MLWTGPSLAVRSLNAFQSPTSAPSGPPGHLRLIKAENQRQGLGLSVFLSFHLFHFCRRSLRQQKRVAAGQLTGVKFIKRLSAARNCFSHVFHFARVFPRLLLTSRLRHGFFMYFPLHTNAAVCIHRQVTEENKRNRIFLAPSFM